VLTSQVLLYSIPYMCIMALVLLACANAWFILFSDISMSDPTSDDVFRPNDTIGQTLFNAYNVLMLSEIQVSKEPPTPYLISRTLFRCYG
jgi:hypothetical protein